LSTRCTKAGEAVLRFRCSFDHGVKGTTLPDGTNQTAMRELLAADGRSCLLPPPCRARAGRNLCVASGGADASISMGEQAADDEPTVAGTGARLHHHRPSSVLPSRPTRPRAIRPRTGGGWPWSAVYRQAARPRRPGPESMKDLQRTKNGSMLMPPIRRSLHVSFIAVASTEHD
jgi:hypothetical protein